MDTRNRMYKVPKNLDLSPVIGEFTTQIRVGQFDIQFTLGKVNFAVTSPVNLLRDGKIVAHWEEGIWPDSGFYDIMNTNVSRCDIVTDRLIVIGFENGLEMHLEDDSEQYESMVITFEGSPSPWII